MAKDIHGNSIKEGDLLKIINLEKQSKEGVYRPFSPIVLKDKELIGVVYKASFIYRYDGIVIEDDVVPLKDPLSESFETKLCWVNSRSLEIIDIKLVSQAEKLKALEETLERQKQRDEENFYDNYMKRILEK